MFSLLVLTHLCFGFLIAGAAPLEADPAEAGAAATKYKKAERYAIDSGLLERVRPLYPNILLERREPGPEESGMPYFSLVKEVARVRAPDGKERLVLRVGWIIPGPYVDRGGGELLIYEDARDKVPMLRKPTFVLNVSQLRLIDNRWLTFGAEEILLSLADKEALLHFDRQGEGALILGLAREAARQALAAYLEEGLEAFLQLAPIRPHQEREVGKLPERISRFDIYPSLVEDSRYSFFKYYDSWEATLLVRLTPADGPAHPVILEMGARGLTGGITENEVELLLYDTRAKEPEDRPGIEQWQGESKGRRP